MKKKPKEIDTVGIFLDPDTDAKIPMCAHADDVGYDLYAIEDTEVLPGTCVSVRTGVHLALPPGMYAQINTRSSHGKAGVYMHHGVIDPGYTGELAVWVMNIANTVQNNGVIRKTPFSIEKGFKIGQLLFHKAETPVLKRVRTLPKTERGAKGHGSTGK